MAEDNTREYITEEEARSVKQLFTRFLKEYKEKEEGMSDAEWLERLFQKEIPGITEEEAKQAAGDTVGSIQNFDDNLRSVNEAAGKGISKESWLAGKLEEASTGMAVVEYGNRLQAMDDLLRSKNEELAEALTRASDGHIKMSPNLDGNIAEEMVATTAELSGALQGKNIKVEVRNAFTNDSVDVRATNLDTGKYQNYQLKFGKDAKATIALIERGNYNNQRIIVPTEQLDEVQAHFQAKGSSKTISDHIEAWGAEGKKFTKEDVKTMQEMLQKDGVMPEVDYNSFQLKDLAKSIGKNAGAMALFSAAVTTGCNIVHKLVKGEPVEADELVESALKTGADTSVKVVAAGTLHVAVKNGILSIIPKSTPAGIIANIACVGIEDAKILMKIASGELSVTKGLDQMGKVTVSMVGGLAGAAKGALFGASLTAGIPVIGLPMSIVTGLVGGMVGYTAGSKVGDAVYNGVRKVAKTAKEMGKTVWNGIKNTGKSIVRGIGRGIGRLLGFA